MLHGECFVSSPRVPTLPHGVHAGPKPPPHQHQTKTTSSANFSTDARAQMSIGGTELAQVFSSLPVAAASSTSNVSNVVDALPASAVASPTVFDALPADSDSNKKGARARPAKVSTTWTGILNSAPQKIAYLNKCKELKRARVEGRTLGGRFNALANAWDSLHHLRVRCKVNRGVKKTKVDKGRRVASNRYCLEGVIMSGFRTIGKSVLSQQGMDGTHHQLAMLSSTACIAYRLQEQIL